MARPSELCEYCPTADSIEFPSKRVDWTDDNAPKWIKLALPFWKGKKGMTLWYFYLHRNYCDSRFRPVNYMLMWLKVSGIKMGPLFPKIRGKEILIAHKRKMFSLELKTIEQWVTVTECLVHMSYEDYSSIINHLFQRVSTLYNKPDYAHVTPYSIRRSAFVWR